MTSPPRTRVVGALVLAVTAISFAAIFFRRAAPTHPLVASGARLAVAALCLAPLVWRARAAGRLPGPVLRSAALGGVAYAVHFGAWVTSLTMTTVAASVTLVAATPMMLAVVGFATKKDRPTPWHVVALIVAWAGLLLIGGGDVSNAGALVGDALALLGALAMAIFMLIARRHGPTLDSWAFSGVATAVGAVVLLGVAFAAGIPIAFVGWRPFGYVVLAALLPQLVGHGLVTWSLRHIRPTTVGIATLAEPVGATLLALLLLGEVPAATTIVGCGLATFGVALAMVRPTRPT